jgi:methylmalonyl-CoA mutase N-terminal domain/subunit
LTAQQPLNNVIRSTVQCLGAVLGGAQSIHVMGYDEAFELPSQQAVTLALRTQQIIALETGVTRTADPLAGSFFVEALTDEIGQRAGAVMAQIEDAGGAVRALERGIPQRWITDAAYRAERDIADGRRPKVGVNVHVTEEGGGDGDGPGQAMELFQLDPGIAERQVARTQGRVAARDEAVWAAAIERLRRDTDEGWNVMPALVEAARAGATVGEMSDVFRAAFGEFREPSPW